MLIVDMNNLVWLMRYGLYKKSDTDQDYTFATQRIMLQCIKKINYVYKHYNCQGLVLAFDSLPSWRHDVYDFYKANRDMEYDELYDKTKEAIRLLQELFKDYTNAVVIKEDQCEADDVIACVSSLYQGEKVILSADKDFIQLIDDQTRLFSPIKDEERTLIDDETKEWHLFEKCIRGDKGDNIFSAYPRVRKTKLEEAFNDRYKMMNLMNTELKDGRVVKDLYRFNRLLIDFKEIPSDVRNRIAESYWNNDCLNYSYVKLLKFFKSQQMKIMIDELDNFKRLLSDKSPIY